MADLKIENVQNLDQPSVQDAICKFKNRNKDKLNVIEVSNIVQFLITTLKLDFDKGRQKENGISVHHLGNLLDVSGGVISQYMSVWKMPKESKDFLLNYDLSLIEAYEVSQIGRGKQKTDGEIIALQKELILKKSRGVGKLKNLEHAIQQAQMIINSVVASNSIPRDILEPVSEKESVRVTAIPTRNNIDKCINFISPRISKLTYLRKQVEFCGLMIENKETKFCGNDISEDCLRKHINIIMDEIMLIEKDLNLPSISSLMVVRKTLADMMGDSK